ncbi:hypothetical protein GGR90_003304 [Sphingopyxis italica]|uniref:Uncharacterized protein n=1 Tax=Sphingopyxis italica TaxID=1129133 RepID=A0A7X5XWI2_9SPHN|nr:hypothetical protein [Sphingopyxis italica]NJB91102.1 hypothetical protein [Sphingopyxis italica]
MATIIAKMAAKISNMPPALSLSRKSRNAERGGKLRRMDKLLPYFVSEFDDQALISARLYKSGLFTST